MDIYDEIERKSKLFINRIHSSIPQQPEAHTITTPVPATFPTNLSEFFDDMDFFRKTPLSTLSDNILILTLPSNKAIQISTDAVVELLRNHYDLPIPYSQISPIPAYPDFSQIDKELTERSFWFSSNYEKIISMCDRTASQIAHQYHIDQSYLLECRIRFLEWEKSLNQIKIQKSVHQQMEAKEDEVRRIQKDYQSKLEKERTEFRTTLENYKIEIGRLQTIASHLKDSTDTYKSKLDNSLEEVTKIRQKLSDLESKSEHLERTLSDTKIKLMRSESELKKYKSAEWTLSLSSTPEKPVFVADTGDPETTKIIEFPSLDDFKENFKATGTEGDLIIYRAGDRKVEVPVSLHNQYPKLIEKLTQSLPKPNEPKEPKKPKTKSSAKKLASNPLRVRDALESVYPEGLARQELADAAHVQYSNMGTYLFKLKNAEQIEEKDSTSSEGRKITKYYYKP